MIHRTHLLVSMVLAGLTLMAPINAVAAPEDFGIESTSASLSTNLAGAHPEVNFDVKIKQDPGSKPNNFGLKDGFATTRNIRVNLPPGLIGNPNVIGFPQQCTAQELTLEHKCPNGAQVGIAAISAYDLNSELREPIYMMQPPGGDVAGRLGTIAGAFPLFINVRVRSEGDYGFISDAQDLPAAARVIEIETTLWGVPAHSSHNNERCTPEEAALGCVISESRPPGSRPLPFWTNPTRCGVPLMIGVNASSWLEQDFPPGRETQASIPTIVGCDQLPFGPALTAQPTSRQPDSPTGLDVTIRLPASDGIDVREPAQMRDIKVTLPDGLVTNAASGDGLGVCSVEQVGFGKREDAHCPDAAKLASTEFDLPITERRMKGAIYLREPEPGNPFRIWIVADDLGVHVKLPGQLNLDPVSGQIESIVLDAPQAPLREVKLFFKSGFRAPLVTPKSCGIYATHYEFTPWSGGPAAKGNDQMEIDQGCSGAGGFAPKLSAGAVDAGAARHSPFVFTLTREDGEQSPASFALSTPRGFAATFAGIPRCEGVAAQTGACPAASRIGKATVALGAGPTPLWIPQAGKRPTAIYLSGPYRGAPLSIIAVVPRQAGPFDFGDEVVRSAIEVDPVTAQATAKTDPLPQIIEGIPIQYRAVHVDLDRPGFALNPTSCARESTSANVLSTAGAVARPVAPFAATDCAKLGFKPKLSFRLSGETNRGAHPRLRAALNMPSGGANIASASVALPHSEFLDQSHIKTVCTRVQFAADSCPAGAIYGQASARSPLLDETLSGPVYLRSSSNPLPDLVIALKGPSSLPIEIDLAGRIDSVNGGIRTTFENAPDAPVSSFVLTMQGGRKGLLVNSTNLCAATHRATAKLTGHNGKQATLQPQLQNDCKRPAQAKRKHRRIFAGR